MPKAFSEQEKEIIGQRLLEQGYKQFSVFGLKKTNIEEIARAAGISKGAFYTFYASKEELFMDVIEETEIRARRELIKLVDLPGATPRARLYKIFKGAVQLFSTIPILQMISGSDYEVLFRRVPSKKLQDHLSSDQNFFNELIDLCRINGINIKVEAGQIVSLFYPLVLTILNQENFPQNQLGGNIDVLLELIAAYCLGEVEVQPQSPQEN
jgi:AcrR family transcriptional regulator